MRKWLTVLPVVGALALAGQALATQGGGGHTPVTLCHRTGSTDGGNMHNGYSLITVDITSAGQAATAHGHDDHEQVGNGPGPDIIPAYTYDDGETVFEYPGKGLDYVFADGTTGAEFLENGCQFNEPEPSPSPSPSPSPDPDPEPEPEPEPDPVEVDPVDEGSSGNRTASPDELAYTL